MALQRQERPTLKSSLPLPVHNKPTHRWPKLRRGGILFGIACITSPCCTPLYVPLALVLLAGTPVALWLSAHIGWLYAGLTLVSVISLVLAFRWWPRSRHKQRAKAASKSEIQSMKGGQ